MESLSQLVSRNIKLCCPWSGISLLQEASIDSGSPATVELFLRAGADPKAGDKSDNGPLHYLAKSNLDDVATSKLLFEYGAHLDRVNKNRKTADQSSAQQLEILQLIYGNVNLLTGSPTIEPTLSFTMPSPFISVILNSHLLPPKGR